MENNMIIHEETATELDLKIKAYANMAWLNLVESCKCLKRMRDTKKYEELGYATFGEYTEASLNIKERQAYTYIATLEKQGEAFLQSNASLGITKLSLLNAIPVTEREDFVANNDIAGMSVAEVEALVKENDGRAEQIDLLSDEIMEKDNALADAKERIAELEKDIKNLENRPTEVAIAEPDAETINKIREEASAAAKKEAEKTFKAEKKELKEKLAAEKDKAVEEAKQGAEKELEELKQKIEDSDAAKAVALKRAEELQKKLAISSSPEATKFSFYFEALDTDYEHIIGSITTLKSEAPEIADKYAEAMQKYQKMVAENFAAIGYPFPSGERKTAAIIKYPNSEDTGACTECGSCCSISDNFCSFCGAEITEAINE